MAQVRAVIWSRRARRKLRNIWAWYKREASPEIADHMLQKAGRDAERLREKPSHASPDPLWPARHLPPDLS